MASLSPTTGVTHPVSSSPVTDDHINYTVQFSAVNAFQSSNYNAQVYTAYYDNFGPNDINALDTEQWGLLNHYFNQYQQYRLAAVRIAFKPAWTPAHIGGILAQAASGNIYSDDDIRVISGFFNPQTEVLLTNDFDDTVVRNGSGSEFFRTRAKPGSKIYSPFDSYEWWVIPHTMDIVATNPGSGASTISAVQPMAAQTNASGSSIVSGYTGGTTGGVDFSAPIVSPWVATKTSRTGGAAQAAVFNQTPVFMGLKVYYWTPYGLATNAASVSISIGTAVYQYFFQFRYLDTRLPLTTALLHDSYTPEELALMRKEFTHAQQKINGSKEPPRLTSPGFTAGTKRKLQEAVEEKGMEVAPLNRVELPPLSRTTAAAPAAPSHHTPSSRPSVTVSASRTRV